MLHIFSMHAYKPTTTTDQSGKCKKFVFKILLYIKLTDAIRPVLYLSSKIGCKSPSPYCEILFDSDKFERKIQPRDVVIFNNLFTTLFPSHI